MKKLTYLLPMLMLGSTLFASENFTYKSDLNIDTLSNGFLTIKDVPDGNYRVKVIVGSNEKPSVTTVRGESRRLFFENVKLKKGKEKELIFTINKRNTIINDAERVKIKKREETKLNWDNNLSFEFAGKDAAVKSIEIEQIDNVPTIFLCGNSTVVDQDNEPWASWGQMIPRFFNENVCFANYAESGESSNTFIAGKRLDKIATQIKPGDYIFVEFGHNDEKQKGPDKGPYKHFTKSLKQYIDLAKKNGATPVLVTPTQRRSFDKDGRLIETHGEFPDAVRKLAEDENITIIDLHKMTTILYEQLGPEDSKKAFVHYPANTFPGQTNKFEDNTHFNPYGAYQIAKCVIEGIITEDIPLKKDIRKEYKRYSPSKPDNIETFYWEPCPFIEIEKPDGN